MPKPVQKITCDETCNTNDPSKRRLVAQHDRLLQVAQGVYAATKMFCVRDKRGSGWGIMISE